jgi:hypothetical protein
MKSHCRIDEYWPEYQKFVMEFILNHKYFTSKAIATEYLINVKDYFPGKIPNNTLNGYIKSAAATFTILKKLGLIKKYNHYTWIKIKGSKKEIKSVLKYRLNHNHLPSKYEGVFGGR